MPLHNIGYECVLAVLDRLLLLHCVSVPACLVLFPQFVCVRVPIFTFVLLENRLHRCPTKTGMNVCDMLG